MDFAELQEIADRERWESMPLDRCAVGLHEYSPIDLKGYGKCKHCSQVDALVQPRERAVMCKLSTPRNYHETWNINGFCDAHQPDVLIPNPRQSV